MKSWDSSAAGFILGSNVTDRSVKSRNLSTVTAQLLGHGAWLSMRFYYILDIFSQTLSRRNRREDWCGCRMRARAAEDHSISGQRPAEPIRWSTLTDGGPADLYSMWMGSAHPVFIL